VRRGKNSKRESTVIRTNRRLRFNPRKEKSAQWGGPISPWEQSDRGLKKAESILDILSTLNKKETQGSQPAQGKKRGGGKTCSTWTSAENGQKGGKRALSRLLVKEFRKRKKTDIKANPVGVGGKRKIELSYSEKGKSKKHVLSVLGKKGEKSQTSLTEAIKGN